MNSPNILNNIIFYKNRFQNTIVCVLKSLRHSYSNSRKKKKLEMPTALPNLEVGLGADERGTLAQNLGHSHRANPPVGRAGHLLQIGHEQLLHHHAAHARLQIVDEREQIHGPVLVRVQRQEHQHVLHQLKASE